jgi:hypothetical protein
VLTCFLQIRWRWEHTRPVCSGDDNAVRAEMKMPSCSPSSGVEFLG